VSRTFGRFNSTMHDVYAEQRRQREERRARQAEPFISEPIPLAPMQQSAGEQPCRCGSADFTVGEGAGPHAARLTCSRCGRFRRWIGRREIEGAAA
jgi:hypothetical protein